MNCLRCGTEIDAEQVFCPDCQADMAKSPVEPGTVILLPRTKDAPAPKKLPHRRIPTPEEQMKTLKKHVKILALGWLITAVLLVLLAYFAIPRLTGEHFLPGQNYSSVTATNPTVSRETPEATYEP